MNNDGKFSTGFLMGLVIGGGAVFLFGTKSGKNLLKIISEQGLDGLANILADYDLEDMEEEEDLSVETEPQVQDLHSNGHAKEDSPKKRFFRRIKK